jgi:hypothetical protein
VLGDATTTNRRCARPVVHSGRRATQNLTLSLYTGAARAPAAKRTEQRFPKPPSAARKPTLTHPAANGAFAELDGEGEDDVCLFCPDCVDRSVGHNRIAGSSRICRA